LLFTIYGVGFQVLGFGFGIEAGSYLRLTGFVYHSTLGLRVIKKKVCNLGDGPVDGLGLEIEVQG